MGDQQPERRRAVTQFGHCEFCEAFYVAVPLADSEKHLHVKPCNTCRSAEHAACQHA